MTTANWPALDDQRVQCIACGKVLLRTSVAARQRHETTCGGLRYQRATEDDEDSE